MKLSKNYIFSKSPQEVEHIRQTANILIDFTKPFSYDRITAIEYWLLCEQYDIRLRIGMLETLREAKRILK